MQRAAGRGENAGFEYGFSKRGTRGLLVALGLALAMGLGALLLLGGTASGVVTLPSGFAKSQLTAGLRSPTAMTFAPDGQVFVAEQGGTLRIVKNGQLLETPFVNISDKVDSNGERGLLGVEFDPDFAENGYVYVYYTKAATSTTPAHNRVVRFTANGDRAVEGSERLLLRLNNLTDRLNHNGGALHFGADGKLYIAVGENGNPENAQSSKNLLGKMLRINSDGSIPADNPYYSNENYVGQDKAIWAKGLRNPFSFAVQPGTGRIFINDVGSNERFHQPPYEEINRGVKGANYGWPKYEGPESNENFRGPVYAYPHRIPSRGTRSPAARSTTPRRGPSRPPTSAITFSRMRRTVGSGGTIRLQTRLWGSRPAYRFP